MQNIDKEKNIKKNGDAKQIEKNNNDSTKTNKKDSKVKGTDLNKNNTSDSIVNYDNKKHNTGITLNSVSRNSNNLTFTNSNGESFNILPSQHKYTAPINAKQRNQVLS